MNKFFALLAVLMASVFAVSCADDDSAADEAGDAIEEAGDDMEDAVDDAEDEMDPDSYR